LRPQSRFGTRPIKLGEHLRTSIKGDTLNKRINNRRHSFEGAISDHQEQGLGGFDIIGIFEVNLFTM
jgi:hypothetical protein